MLADMERVETPVEGLTLSRLAFGAMRLPVDEPDRIPGLIERAVSLGITTFDHADIYGGYAVEEAFGAALQAWGGDRDDLELVSKCDIMLPVEARPESRIKHYDTSAQHVLASVDRSLANLGAEHLDVLLLHRPDPLLDADETAAALDGLVASGKVRAIGVSNFAPHQVDLLASRLDVPVVTNQVELSVTAPEALWDGSLDHAQQHGYPPMIWSALGGGGLFASDDARAARIREALAQVGADVGLSPGATALAWVLRHPSRPVPVTGSMNPERLADLAGAVHVELDRQQWFAILEASTGLPVP